MLKLEQSTETPIANFIALCLALFKLILAAVILSMLGIKEPKRSYKT